MWPSRFRLRRLVFAVAFAALACGGEVIGRRQEVFASRARLYREIEAAYSDPRGETDLAHHCGRRHRDRWAHLRHKYERAARYPFLPLEPDVSVPEQTHGTTSTVAEGRRR